MRIVRWLLLSVLLAANAAFADSSASPDDQYVLGPDSEVQPGVPEGKVTEFVLKDSKVFPGYEHKWWLYVPAQYDGKKPIALMAQSRRCIPRAGGAEQSHCQGTDPRHGRGVRRSRRTSVTSS